MCHESSAKAPFLRPSLRLSLDRLQDLHEFRAFIERLDCAFKVGQNIYQIAEPEDSLFCFLERDADLVDEVRYRFGTIRLMIVRTDVGR